MNVGLEAGLKKVCADVNWQVGGNIKRDKQIADQHFAMGIYLICLIRWSLKSRLIHLSFMWKTFTFDSHLPT